MTKLPHFTLILLSVLLLVFISPTFQYPAPLPAYVTKNLASREFRYHHLLFHNLRNTWNQLSSSAQAEIRAYGWAPPRPSKDASGATIKDNNAGEDFMYMHRLMINMANRLMKTAGASNMVSFKEIPSPSDPDFPLPPKYTAPTAQLTYLVEYYKSDDWYDYAKKIEARLANPAFLRTLTMGELGTYIEYVSDIHQGLHFRYSKENPLMRFKSAGGVPYIEPKWDVTASNWLPDLYSSHLNPWFFKLHGWINDRIDDWAAANGIKTLKWNYTWVGGSLDRLPDDLDFTPNTPTRYLRQGRNLMDMSMDMDMDMEMEMNNREDEGCGMGKMNVTVMEEVAKILEREGVRCEYYSEVDPSKLIPLERLKKLDITDLNF